MLDYTTPGKPSIVPYIPRASSGNILFQGPITCDFDGSTAAFGDASGNVYLFLILGEGAPDFSGLFEADLGAITSVAVMVNLAAASNLSDGFVSLIDVEPVPERSPVTLTLVGSGKGADPGGVVRFLGLADLAVSTNNGSGVTWLNTLNPVAPSPVRVAQDAVLAPASRPTLGLTAFNV
jgi:hypothetical protein